MDPSWRWIAYKSNAYLTTVEIREKIDKYLNKLKGKKDQFHCVPKTLSVDGTDELYIHWVFVNGDKEVCSIDKKQQVFYPNNGDNIDSHCALYSLYNELHHVFPDVLKPLRTKKTPHFKLFNYNCLGFMLRFLENEEWFIDIINDVWGNDWSGHFKACVKDWEETFIHNATTAANNNNTKKRKRKTS